MCCFVLLAFCFSVLFLKSRCMFAHMRRQAPKIVLFIARPIFHCISGFLFPVSNFLFPFPVPHSLALGKSCFRFQIAVCIAKPCFNFRNAIIFAHHVFIAESHLQHHCLYCKLQLSCKPLFSIPNMRQGPRKIVFLIPRPLFIATSRMQNHCLHSKLRFPLQ